MLATANKPVCSFCFSIILILYPAGSFLSLMVLSLIDVSPLLINSLIWSVAHHFPKSCFLWGILFSCHKINLQTGKSIVHQFEGLHKLWDTPEAGFSDLYDI